MHTASEEFQPAAIELNLVQASSGKRFANYLIDLICFYLCVFLWGVVIAIVSPSTIDSLDDSPFGTMSERLITLILYGVFMGLIEGIFRGKSIGKFITGTKAVNEFDG